MIETNIQNTETTTLKSGDPTLTAKLREMPVKSCVFVCVGGRGEGGVV